MSQHVVVACAGLVVITFAHGIVVNLEQVAPALLRLRDEQQVRVSMRRVNRALFQSLRFGFAFEHLAPVVAARVRHVHFAPGYRLDTGRGARPPVLRQTVHIAVVRQRDSGLLVLGRERRVLDGSADAIEQRKVRVQM